MTRMRKYGKKLYSEISQETDLDTSTLFCAFYCVTVNDLFLGWKEVGSLHLAHNEGRLTYLKRNNCLGRCVLVVAKTSYASNSV